MLNYYLFSFLAMNRAVFNDGDKAALDCVRCIKRRGRLKRQKEIARALKTAEERGEESKIRSLLDEYQNLVKAEKT